MPGTFQRVVEKLKSATGAGGSPKEEAATAERDIVAKVQKLFDSRDKSTLEQFHRQWFINIAMRRGHQWLLTSSASSEISMPPEEVDRVRMTINEMLPIHLTKLAKLIRETPRWSIDYEDMDEDAKESARADEAFLKAKFLSEDMTEEMVTFLGWCIDTGNVFWKPVWDHDAGEALPDDEGLDDEESNQFGNDDGDDSEDQDVGEDEEMSDADYEPPVFAGDCDLITVSPFDIVPSQMGKPLNKQRWIQHVYECDIDDIEEEWGVKVKPDGGKDTRDYYQRRLATMIGVQNEYLGGGTENKKANTALVIEHFERPSPKRPRGTYIVTAGGQWLNKTKSGKPAPLPYKYLIEKRYWFPLIHMKDIPVSGSFFAMGTMENLIAPQKGYNRFWSQVLENANNFGNIKLLADDESELMTEAFDDSGNEVIRHSTGHAPTMLQPVSLPNHVMAQGDMYKTAFEDISGQHEPTNAKAPGGVNSGVALAQLQEQDDTRNAPTLIFFRNSMRLAGEHLLCMYREMMSDGEVRSIKYPGTKGGKSKMESMTIGKDQLRPNPMITVTLESTAAWQKETRRQQIQNGYKEGLFGPPGKPSVQRRVLDALEFGDMKSFFHDNDLDEQNAQDNIERIQDKRDLDMIAGPPPPPMPPAMPGLPPPPPQPPQDVPGIKAYPWEDHEEHLRVYNNFRKSGRYRNEWDDGRRGMLDHLADEHASMLADANKPAPEPPKVNISAKTEVPSDSVMEYAGLPESKIPPPAPLAGEPLLGSPPAPGTADLSTESTPAPDEGLGLS